MPSHTRAFQAATAAPMIVPQPGSPTGAPATVVEGLRPTQTDVGGELGLPRYDKAAARLAHLLGSAATLERLRDEERDAHAAVLSVSDQHRSAHADWQSAQRQANDIMRRLKGGMWPTPTDEALAQDARYAPAKATLDHYAAILAKIGTRQKDKAARWNTLKRVVQACEEYLENLPANAELVEVTATPKKSDTVDSVRAKIAELTAKIEAYANLSYTANEAKAIISAQLDAGRKRGTPNLLGTLHHREDMRLQRVKAEHADGSPNHQAFIPDVLGLMIWAWGDDLERKLHEEIDKRCDHDNAMSATDRAGGIEKASADLLALERVECAICEATGAQYRPETDPRAVLGIEVKHD